MKMITLMIIFKLLMDNQILRCLMNIHHQSSMLLMMNLNSILQLLLEEALGNVKLINILSFITLNRGKLKNLRAATKIKSKK